MLALLRKLHRTRLLTVPGACQLLGAVATTGVNMMAMLRVAAGLFPRRAAVTDDRERLTYLQLWRQSDALAAALHAEFGIRPRQKVAVACRNHAACVKAIFALSRLGAHLYFVNPEMRTGQLLALEERLHFDFYVYDDPLALAFAEPPLRDKSLPAYHPSGPSVEQLASRPVKARPRLKKVRGGNIVVLSGGTTGQPKTASRKPSIFDYLLPFSALLTRLDLDECLSFYLAPPIYHSFGLSALALAVMLGAEMHLTTRFDAARACELIARHRIDAVAVVPLMLRRMLHHDAAALTSLRRVVSGSDTLTPALAGETLDRLGPVLFNLYGTAEGGMVSLADPAELRRKPGTVGQAIRGVGVRLLDENDREVSPGAVGRVCVRSAWAAGEKGWVDTGDLAYRDDEGYLFLCGRADDMIVSGGENVYPVELENVLARHPDVAAAAAVGIPDAEFGQRLKAVVVAREGSALDTAGLLAWLRDRVARHQMPAAVEFRGELPYTPVGKPDKKALRG
jgi:acyl-CoA synthetase (AMP-forming)/AMP-acid ligase II